MTRAHPLIAAAALAALLLVASCKPPRAPREAAAGSVTGRWHATSDRIDPRTGLEGEGELSWRLDLEERRAGTLAGRGSVAGGGDSATFVLDGVRGESELTLELELAGQPAMYRGSVLGPSTLVGEMEVAGGRVKVVFERR